MPHITCFHVFAGGQRERAPRRGSFYGLCVSRYEDEIMREKTPPEIPVTLTAHVGANFYKLKLTD